MQMQLPPCPRNFAEHLLGRGEKGESPRASRERGIEISDSNLNSAFERQPWFGGETAGGRYSLRRLAQEDGRKMGPSLPPFPDRKNRFKLAPRVPKPRFKKLVKNCQRFSSFILFFPRPLFFFHSSTTPVLLTPLLCSNTPFPELRYEVSLPQLVYPGKACLVPCTINICD